METYEIPYAKTHLKLNLEKEYINGVLTSQLEEYKPSRTQTELVKDAMANPIGSKRLSELAVGKNSCTIIISDHTRPVPSKVIIPFMLSELREANPNIKITLLVATGCHRGTTKDELIGKLSEKIVKEENIYIHDCQDESMLATVGTLPSGAVLRINKLAVETDLLVSEGFIEPHFFAGFSGGRKSVLPGVCAQKTVMGNHCAKFIESVYSRSGILENNPIHKDMVAAARMAKLAFIVNVIINSEKEVVAAVAGDFEKAHLKGCEFLNSKCRVKSIKSDIVITSNGGYPLDQNLYQTVKGMTAAEACGNENAVIIICSACNDGSGGEEFYKALNECSNPTDLLNEIVKIPMDETIQDQWQYQILARIMKRFTVIVVCELCSKEIIEGMKMLYAKTLDEAVETARKIKGNTAKFTVIPDGIAVIVE